MCIHFVYTVGAKPKNKPTHSDTYSIPAIIPPGLVPVAIAAPVSLAHAGAHPSSVRSTPPAPAAPIPVVI